MYNWILTRDANGNVWYKVKNGKDFTVHYAPYEKALHICNRGVVRMSGDADYPISVDGVFMFKGQIEKWEKPKVDEPALVEAEPKKKVKKKTTGD